MLGWIGPWVWEQVFVGGREAEVAVEPEEEEGHGKVRNAVSYNISSCSINDETRQDFLSAKKLISTAIVRDANFFEKKNSGLIKF